MPRTSQIFEFPCANDPARRNFARTIEQGVQLDKVLSRLTDTDLRRKLQENAVEGRSFLWGSRVGQGRNLKIWGRMEEADIVLAYRDSSIVAVARVIGRLRSTELARDVWEGNDPDPFELIYLLAHPQICHVPVAGLNWFFSEPHRSLKRIEDDRIQIVIDRYGSIDDFIAKELTGGALAPVKGTASGENPPPAKEGDSMLEPVINYISDLGFVFEPWQIAAYVTALRTKPFVILAGISGTGKSKLPALVAAGTGAESHSIPVRPDWTDSSEIVGYLDLQGSFRPGVLLEYARRAMDKPDRFFVCLVDEMNIARVEYYFAEVLSRIEDRKRVEGGVGFESKALVDRALGKGDERWGLVRLPPNLALVGSVNMDETTHGFSRKVLDRAFTLELSDVDLGDRSRAAESVSPPAPWPLERWVARALRLPELGVVNAAEEIELGRCIVALTELNRFLVHAQLQVGYRTRDEVVLFVLHAGEWKTGFRTRSGQPVDPLDLALVMKILPRLAGAVTRCGASCGRCWGGLLVARRPPTRRQRTSCAHGTRRDARVCGRGSTRSSRRGFVSCGTV